MNGPGEDREEQEQGQGLLARLSNEMVRAQKRFFGKGPTEAKSHLLDDVLLIVMRGGLTTAEKTMLFDSAGHHEDRSATAAGQLRDDDTGEATDEDALDAPSGAGQ